MPTLRSCKKLLARMKSEPQLTPTLRHVITTPRHHVDLMTMTVRAQSLSNIYLILGTPASKKCTHMIRMDDYGVDSTNQCQLIAMKDYRVGIPPIKDPTNVN